MSNANPYDNCPVYTSERFHLRLVEQKDAEDLLQCYSDVSATRLMNADNCGGTDFYFRTLDEMTDYIEGWLDGYRRHIIIRFSVIDTQSSRTIGTVEMYAKTKNTGVLRLDLCPAYETRDHIFELLEVSVEGFRNAFGVQNILTKAIPDATERISALCAYGFAPAERHAMMPFGDYYIHDNH